MKGKGFYWMNGSQFLRNNLDLITAMENADYVFWRTISQSAVDTEWVTAVFTGIDKAILNPVVRAEFPAERASEMIVQIKAFYLERNVPWAWCIGESKKTSALVQALEEAGLHLTEVAPRMAIQLSAFHSVKNDVQTREVLTQRDFFDWSIPIRSGFGGNDDRFAELLSRIPCGPGKTMRHYVAYDQGVPVSACTLTLSRFGAKLDNMATSTLMQRKGFGAALLSKALLDAKESGVQFCFLHSSEEGFPLYSKIGFQTLDQLNIFELRS